MNECSANIPGGVRNSREMLCPVIGQWLPLDAFDQSYASNPYSCFPTNLTCATGKCKVSVISEISNEKGFIDHF